MSGRQSRHNSSSQNFKSNPSPNSKSRSSYSTSSRNYNPNNSNNSSRSHQSTDKSFHQRDSKDSHRTPKKQNTYHNTTDEDHSIPKEPTNVLMLRGLNPSTTQDRLTDFLKSFGPVDDVRLITHHKTGESRCFAFADFPSVEEAHLFLEAQGHQIDIDGYQVSVDFSRQKPLHATQATGISQHTATEYKDWLCNGCGASNFARRTVCFICHTPKPLNPIACNVNEENNFYGSYQKDPTSKENTPCSILVVRGLDPATVEDTIYSIFANFATVKEVRLIRDKHNGVSRGFCFVEYHTVEDTTYALQNSTQMRIDDRLVKISYARKNFNYGTSASDSVYGTNLGGSIALEQAQWATSSIKGTESSVQPGGKGGLPGPGFVWDPSSGYLYNSATGYYYDPNTGYYYDTSLGLYYYYDSVSSSYLQVQQQTESQTNQSEKIDSAVDKIESVVVENKDEKKTEKKTKKTKSVRKTVGSSRMTKEMERWMMKTKELKDELEAEQQKETELKEEKEKDRMKIKFQITGMKKVADNNSNTNVVNSSPAVQEVIEAQPKISVLLLPDVAQKLDVICLLCKKQFKDADGLIKHRQLSNLHKHNIQVARSTLCLPPISTFSITSTNKRPAASTWKNNKRQKKKSKSSSSTPSASTLPSPVTAGPPGISIPASNKGNQMLKRMGWKEGEGLGRDGAGITAPVSVVMRSERAGLGSGEEISEEKYVVRASDSYQEATRKKARARFERLMGQ